MGMMERTLQRLFPPGRAWWLPGNTGLLVQALAVSLETARAFIRAIWAESVPWTAAAMLQEWNAALGVRYDPTQSVAFQQRMLDAVLTAVGNTTLNQLNGQMHKELASVNFSEIAYGGTTSIAGESECGFDECNSTVPGTDANPYSYLVSGTVENDAEAARVISVIAHFSPLHLQPTSSLIILSDTGTAECGIAVCGIEECGYAP